MNRDEGAYELSRSWDSVIPTIDFVSGEDQEELVPTIAVTNHQVAAVLRKMADVSSKLSSV